MPLLGFATARAQNDDADNVVIFVLDLSGSMNEPFDDSQTKLDVAKAAFVEAFANVSPDAQVGLRTYGDQIEPTDPAGRELSCTTDTRLVAPIAPLERERLIDQVQGFSALGDTPMGLALQQASTDIGPDATGTIVLFSDGRDECFDADLDGDPANGPSFGEDPCEIAKAIAAGSTSVDRVVTVGFRADTAAAAELRCIADATGGTYTSIESPEDARSVLPELLVQLSAPREAQRLVGRTIEGGATEATAPTMVRLNEIDARQVLYTDTIDINTERFYAFDAYGPGAGTLTGTVFGLPAQSGITFDLRLWVPSLNRVFFEDEHADTNAGLPARQTSSIRCTGCQISGGPHDVFWILSLTSTDPAAAGTYELEILTEGPAFGGVSSSCIAPQQCFYPQAISDQKQLLTELQDRLTGSNEEAAPQSLIDERDALQERTTMLQERFDRTEARSLELEALIPTAPAKSNSFKIPLLMVFGGLLLALAPLDKLRRSRSNDDQVDELDQTQGPGEPSQQPQPPASVAPPMPAPPAADGRTGPSLDVGPPPAVSPNLKASGNSWDAELEAAKAALAQQRPERPSVPGEPTLTPDAPSPAPAPPTPAPADPPSPGAGFTAEQHAAAKAAAEAIIAQQTATAASEATAMPGPPALPLAPAPVEAIELAPAPPAEPVEAIELAAAQPAERVEAQEQQQAANEPGWYPDPTTPSQFRWWSGEKWTEHTSNPTGEESS